MIPVAEAQRLVLALAAPLGTETVPLAQAAGRRMREAAAARRDQPPFDASAMDGYAVAGDPRAGETFRVVGEAGAGHAHAGVVGPNEAVRISTGAPVPAGATRILLQEDVAREGDRITLAADAGPGTHIRPRGGDFAAGRALDPRWLRPNDLALLAAMNIPAVTASRRPVVALVATGDELVMPGETPRADQIVCSNTFALKALAEEAGAEARLLPIARDTPAELAFVLGLAADADLIVTVGGASVGDHDLVGRVAGLERAFHRVAMRPGKPLMAGRLSGVPMLGLPGNPVSAIVCAHLFLLPLIRAMQGDPDPLPRMAQGRLGCDVGPAGPRTHYMRARREGAEGVPRLHPFDDQDSALLSVLAQADALLVRPAGDGPRQAGEPAGYLPI